MARIAFLDESTTTRTTMTTISHNNHSISARSNEQHGLGVYQLTAIGASNATIRTLVPIPISTPPPLYRKALVAKIFCRQILEHAVSPSISFSDWGTTVATYFDTSTVMTEREA